MFLQCTLRHFSKYCNIEIMLPWQYFQPLRAWVFYLQGVCFVKVQLGTHLKCVCVCLFVLPQGCSDVSGFIQAVLGLLLPLGYEYDPSLVLLVRMPGSELCDAVWQQLTGLLQGLAQGHTLILMQVRRPRGKFNKSTVNTTFSRNEILDNVEAQVLNQTIDLH